MPQQAVELATQESVEASLISRASTLLADLKSRASSVRERAEQTRKDQEFKTELELIRLSQSDGTSVTVALAAQVETRKAKIVVADTPKYSATAESDDPEATSDPETSGEAPESPPDESENRDESDAAPVPESAVAQIFDVSSSLKRYEEAFRNAGIDLRAMTVPEAATRVRSSAIQETLIGAIDNWARGLDESESSLEDNPSSETVAGLSRQKLLAIASAADSSEWRRTVRTALERNDTAQLKELAVTDEARSQSPELIAWLGAVLRDGDEVDRAIAVLLEGQRNHPGDFWLNYELGKSYVRKGQNLEGLGFARTALGIRPENAGAMIALAVASSESGRQADALRLYRAVLAKNPRLFDAQTGLGLVAIQMADWDTAMAAYRAAIELKPGNGELYGALALALRSTQHYVEAADMAQKGVEVDPTNAQAHIYRGRVLEGLQIGGVSQNEAARAAYQKAIEFEPSNARAFYYLGYLRGTYLGDNGGLEDLRTAIQLDPQFAEPHAALGARLYDQKQYDESLAACEKAIELAPNSSIGYCSSIRPLVAKNQFSQAVANGRRAIALNPQDGIAYSLLGETLRRQGNNQEALEIGRRGLELAPNDWSVVALLAESLKSQGVSDQLAIYSQILEWAPESAVAASGLQSVLFQDKTLDLNRLRDLANKFPKSSQLLNGIAWTLATTRDEQGQYQHIDDAVRWAKTACELTNDDGTILNTLGVAYYRQGQWQAALDTLQKSHAKNRGEPSDVLFLAMAHQQLGDRPQSLDFYAQALTLRGTKNFDGETMSFYTETQRLLDPQREELETLLAREPDNAFIARELADLLLASTNRGWTVLQPKELKSEGGATLTLLEDGSILASGKNPDQDAYQLTANVGPRHITAIRLEVLPDSSLPQGGPGRYPDNGNFHLNEFRVLINGTPHKPGGITVSYAELEQYRHIIDGTIDANVWGSNGRPGKPNSAVIATDLQLGPDDTLTLELISSRATFARHNLGRFRLSVTDDPTAFDRDNTRFAAMKITDPWARLAAAHHVVGDQQALDKLLQQHSQAASLGLAKFLVESGKTALAAQRPNEALPQLAQARELVANVAAKHPASEWTVLQPAKLTSSGGATLTTLEDNSVLASGTNPWHEVYEFETQLKAGLLTAIRLEGLAHASLPHQGHGRANNSGTILTEFEAAVAANGEATEWRSIQFGGAWADHTQPGSVVEGAIDGNSGTYWTTDGNRRRENRVAVFALATPFEHAEGTRLRIRLRHESHAGAHVFGRFRLSVTSDPNAIEAARVNNDLKTSGLAELEMTFGNVYGQLGQFDQATTAFSKSLDLANDREARMKIVQAASAYDGVLEKLAEPRSKNAAFHDALARHYQASGNLVAARAAAATARPLYEQQLAAEPENFLGRQDSCRVAADGGRGGRALDSPRTDRDEVRTRGDADAAERRLDPGRWRKPSGGKLPPRDEDRPEVDHGVPVGGVDGCQPATSGTGTRCPRQLWCHLEFSGHKSAGKQRLPTPPNSISHRGLLLREIPDQQKRLEH